jgi:hypothetical protein
MRTRRKTTAVIAAVIVAPFIGVSRSPAELPVTIPGAPTAEGGTATLLDVTITDTGTADEVTFTFAEDALPGVDATAKAPPFFNTAGDVITVPGTSRTSKRR